MSLVQRLLAVSAAGLLNASADLPIDSHLPTLSTNARSRRIEQPPVVAPPAALIGYFFDANKNGKQDEHEEASTTLGHAVDSLPEGVVVSGYISYESGRGKAVHIVFRDILADVILINTFVQAPSYPFLSLEPQAPVGVFTFNTAGWKKGVLQRKEKIYIVDKLILHMPPPEVIPRSQVREMSYRELITGTRMYDFECRIEGKVVGSVAFSIQYSPLSDDVPVEHLGRAVERNPAAF